MSGTAPLFEKVMTLDEKMYRMERLADQKLTHFSISIGYQKSKNLHRTHTAMVVGTTKNGNNITLNPEAESTIALYDLIIDFFEKLNS